MMMSPATSSTGTRSGRGAPGGFATYAAIRQLGRQGVAALIDRCCRHAVALVGGIGQLPGAQVLWPAQLNQGLVRFLDPNPTASDEHHDRFTNAVLQELLADGEAFFMGTTWRGCRAMRVSVLNWQTAETDVARAIAAVSRCLVRLQTGRQ
ncbi:hypothetical protein [Paludibaculum fermentans]|uniref:hypothetical protein n=1 Tax=Paludibaculum fermentans TaxID=1473598 RepID=UPI003EC0B799